jgi:hypothetical protein
MQFGMKSVVVRVVAFVAVLSLPFVGSGATRAAGSVAPNQIGEMDCNGWSSAYQSVKPGMRALCTDPFALVNGKPWRFYDNGYYVGHDEPSLKFISSAPGSGNHMTYNMQLATDPSCTPTTSPTGTTCSHYAELSPAPWFGLPICDPNSFPQNPCTPDSDSNTGMGSKTDAGSAFMELQFYPPGFAPFTDSLSCDATRYCAALNIDSLECTTGNYCNHKCTEPVNFAYIQRDGTPTGPPSPQLSNVATLNPNSETLYMNPGDRLKVTIQDTSDGLKTTVQDLSSGQTGSMVASAANGFMNTDLHTCNGTPFTFHAEYSSASVQNQVPWAALEGGVLMEDEIGHFEPCSSVTNPFPLSLSIAGQSFSDPSVHQTCTGSFEAGGSGEGPCVTSLCAGSTTEGGAACPHKGLCELSDALCFPAGSRTVTTNGVSSAVTAPVANCQANWFQNGDLDFDGSPYIPDWPDGMSTHPTSYVYTGPFDATGNTYPFVQFETDVGASEQNCNVVSGAGCTVPPVGAVFYPFWTVGRATAGSTTSCFWNFGNTIPGTTANSLGGDTQYGTPNTARFAGTIISPVQSNPQLSC